MISILLATTGRPDMAERCVRQARETAWPVQLEIVAAVDADPETHKRLRPFVDRMSYSDDYRGCSKAWNAALALSTGDPVVLAADDLIWRHGWDTAALAKMQEFPDGWGLVGFNDGHWGEDLSTHFMMSRRFIVEVLGGIVAWPCYTHSFNDVEINERAKAAGRYAWCKDAVVLHEHWLFGNRPQDDTDQRNLPGWQASSDAFQRRQAAGFPNDYEPVIT